MANPFLSTLAANLDKFDTEQDESAELWPRPDASQVVLPVVRKIAEEIGTDQLLAEAALAWVRQKKQELLVASLGIYYTPEQLEAMRKKAEEQAA